MDVIIYKVGEKVYRTVCAEGVDINAEAKKVVPDGVTFKIINNDLMPSHVFRSAWDFDGSEVDVDIEKGKEVCHRIRRIKRDEAMADNLDIVQRNAAGIPLAPGEDATAAANANASYKANVDDVAQSAIESATTETELLDAIKDFL